MRTMRAILLIAVLAMLAAPTAAPAKGIKGVTVCGSSGCHEVKDSQDQQWIVGGNQPVNPPGTRAPFYEVRVKVGGEGFSDGWTNAYLPSLHYMRGYDENTDPAWTVVQSPQGLRALREAMRGLKPFPASKLGPMGSKIVTGAKVVEVYEPAKNAPAADGSNDGFDVLPWLLGAAAAALVLGVGLVARRRTRIPRFPEA